MNKRIEATTSAEKMTASNESTWARTIRETVESVVIAFILAFMFRTFEAEAFVIPTGSMAPTLQGRHKDVVCPECGYEYRVGASEEVDSESGAMRVDKAGKPICPLETTRCPMCGYTVDVNSSTYPSYNGDRIIVNKFAYDLAEPQRWDVVVFKFPEDCKKNYIKRLIGLPNEHIALKHGDVYVAPLGSDKFELARKPPEKVRETLQPVYDNNYVVPKLIQAGMPQSWQPWTATAGSSPWKVSADYKSFSAEGSQSSPAWLRYQHFLPDDAIWDALQAGQPFQPPRPSLITDFYAYNDGEFLCGGSQPKEIWVGDLAVECNLKVKTASGSVILELVKGGRQFRCHLDLVTGEAKLSILGNRDFAPTAKTALNVPGNYSLLFTNVDQQLLLWIDNKLVAFDAPTTYPDLKNTEPVQQRPIPGADQSTDLSPVGIAVDGGASVDVSHLVIRRDVYYLSSSDNGYVPSTIWSSIDLQPDEFFMLGDNSPRSSDGRYWPNQHYVDRRLLIGKALFIYWPHSFNYVEVGDKKIPFPYWPNFSRMRFVH